MENEHVVFLTDIAAGNAIYEEIDKYAPHISADLPFPRGFVIRSEVFGLFLGEAKNEVIEAISDITSLEEASEKVSDILAGALLPPEVELSLARAFTKLTDKDGWGLILPPCHDTPHVFAYPVVNDKISLLREVRETYMNMFTPKNIMTAREKIKCPIIVLKAREAEATGTLEITPNSIVVNASKGWMAMGDSDTYVISLEDGHKIEENIGKHDSIHQLTEKGFIETRVEDGSRNNLSEDTLLDLHGIATKFLEWGKYGKEPFVFSWLLPIEKGRKPLVMSLALLEKKKIPVSKMLPKMETPIPLTNVQAFLPSAPPAHDDMRVSSGSKPVVPHGTPTIPDNEPMVPDMENYISPITDPKKAVAIPSASAFSPSPTSTFAGHPTSASPKPSKKVLVSSDIKLPIQPTATGIISIGGMEPWFPPNIGTWVDNETNIPAEGVLDAYVSIGNNIALLDGILNRVKAGRVFLIVSPRILEEARKVCKATLPEHRAMILAHITQSSEAFLSEEMARYSDGVMIDTPVEGPNSTRILSRTVEAITRSIGPGKKVVVNAKEHFWSEEFLYDIIAHGTYAIAVDMGNVAIATNLVASTERRILLWRRPEEGK